MSKLQARASHFVAVGARAGQAVRATLPAETALRESEERYRTLYDNIPLMYFTLNGDGVIISVNAHGAEQLGYKQEELTGKSVLEVLHEDDHSAVKEQLFDCVQNPGRVRRWGLRKIRKDGTMLWVQESARAVSGQGSTIVLVVCEDVTERKQTEQQLIEHRIQLQSLASELALTEERERRQIALALHDQIGQALTLATAELGKLSEIDPATVGRARQYLWEAVQATRSLTFELSSPVLYELGLEPAIRSLGDSIVQKNEIRFHFEADDKPCELPEETKIGLFRTVRELLFNCVKHSCARNVMVSVRRPAEQIVISVQDDGVGFDAAGAGERVSPTGGFGLFSIHEQMEHIGGRFTIASAPGRGTRATVVVFPGEGSHCRRESQE